MGAPSPNGVEEAGRATAVGRRASSRFGAPTSLPDGRPAAPESPRSTAGCGADDGSTGIAVSANEDGGVGGGVGGVVGVGAVAGTPVDTGTDGIDAGAVAVAVAVTVVGLGPGLGAAAVGPKSGATAVRWIGVGPDAVLDAAEADAEADVGTAAGSGAVGVSDGVSPTSAAVRTGSASRAGGSPALAALALGRADGGAAGSTRWTGAGAATLVSGRRGAG